MKSYTFVPLYVAAAYAQINGDFGPNCGVVNIPVSDLLPQVQVIGQALVDVNTTTAALNDSINAFDGTIATVANVQIASTNLLNQISSSNASVAAIPVLTNSTDDEGAALDLPRFVTSLACAVNRTVANLINRKQDFVDACVGPLVLDSAQQQQTAATSFSDTTLGKLPEDLQAEGQNLVQPINDALSSAVAAYATETTTPASCGGTSVTTTGGTPPTSTPTSGGGETPTTSGGNVYPTGPGNTYPTGPTGSYPTGGGVYPTGEQPPAYTTTPNYGGTWQPIPGTSYSAEQPTYGTSEGEQPTYGTSEGSVPSSYTYAPSATYPAETTEAPVYSTSGPGYTAPPQYTTEAPIGTTSYVPPAYTGAAVANAAHGFGAAALAAVAVAMF